jgi:hypothetical protein
VLLPPRARGARAPAAHGPLSDLLTHLDPLLCVARDPALKGRTEFYDPKGQLLHSSAGGAPQDAIVVVLDKKLPLFKAVLEHKCLANTEFNAKKLRELGQGYAIEEFIAFDHPENRVKLKNGLFSETRTNLYKGKDGLVHIGREKIVSGNGTIVTSEDPNMGTGVGYEDQTGAQSVGRLHTHPNSDNREMAGVPAHHPSGADVSSQNEAGYYDVVVSPLFVFFINNKNASAMVFSIKDTFSNNAVKGYLAKNREAEAYYEKAKTWPAWYTDGFNKDNNPWAR